MRLAILGAGMIVRDLLAALPHVPAVVPEMMYARPESILKARELATAHGVARVVTDIDEAVSDSRVDAVYIGLPNDLHVDAARRAIWAGKHVIVEKPFVPSLAEFDDLVSLARGAGVVLAEAITTVHLSGFLGLQRAMAGIGRVRLVESVYVQRSSRYDAFLAGDTPPAFDHTRFGGALRDIGVYPLHVLVGLMGAPDGVLYTPTIQRGVDTSGVVTMRWEGATGVAVCGKDAASRSHTIVYGEEGTLEWLGPPNAGGVLTAVDRSGARTVLATDAAPHRMVPEFHAFARMIDSGDLVTAGALLEHSRKVMVALGAAASALN